MVRIIEQGHGTRRCETQRQTRDESNCGQCHQPLQEWEAGICEGCVNES
jgi:hypothetical protein